ncbi:putative aminoacrylate hydrolase RutD [Heracleum sosnowskyi]|uniref:Aminoacrylate hydrolase RutD n=1 Tax=Heracleum sosnowskyi TaxID=360622 RepID=A0AAD8MHX0_9APIA|nr:putative aminoacrylate hydrolase RutD [Heracleum sosnowskyi]
MAAAEARAAWQRAANRCFVQEDAKRAPKLACCPSSGASTKQVDSGPASATDGQDYRVPGFVPLNNNPSYTNVPPDTKWWLQLQPNYGSQRGFSNEQLNTLETEMDIYGAGFASLNVKSSRVHLKNAGALITKSSNSEASCATESRVCASFLKKEHIVNKQELKAVYTKSVHEPIKVKDGEESYEFIEMDHVDSASFKTSDMSCLDSESPLIVSGKRDPWWKTTDSNELASLVAQRSLDLVENCDLPQPQTTHRKRDLPQPQTTHIKRDLPLPQSTYLKRDPYACVGFSDHDRSKKSSGDLKHQSADRSIPPSDTSGSGPPGGGHGSNWSVEGSSESGIDKSISYNKTKVGQAETQISAKDPCKAQLLEALRHSQTRAREAEMAVKQAYAEKEDVVKLFFRQASQLFAYRQWLQLLQLENLYYQIKSNKNHPVSALFPGVLPWMPLRNRKVRRKGKRPKQERPRCNISKYALMFALGLSLVGAGLFLGWTIGWMLPAL